MSHPNQEARFVSSNVSAHSAHNLSQDDMSDLSRQPFEQIKSSVGFLSSSSTAVTELISPTQDELSLHRGLGQEFSSDKTINSGTNSGIIDGNRLPPITRTFQPINAQNTSIPNGTFSLRGMDALYPRETNNNLSIGSIPAVGSVEFSAELGIDVFINTHRSMSSRMPRPIQLNTLDSIPLTDSMEGIGNEAGHNQVNRLEQKRSSPNGISTSGAASILAPTRYSPELTGFKGQNKAADIIGTPAEDVLPMADPAFPLQPHFPIGIAALSITGLDFTPRLNDLMSLHSLEGVDYSLQQTRNYESFNENIRNMFPSHQRLSQNGTFSHHDTNTGSSHQYQTDNKHVFSKTSGLPAQSQEESSISNRGISVPSIIRPTLLNSSAPRRPTPLYASTTTLPLSGNSIEYQVQSARRRIEGAESARSLPLEPSMQHMFSPVEMGSTGFCNPISFESARVNTQNFEINRDMFESNTSIFDSVQPADHITFPKLTPSMPSSSGIIGGRQRPESNAPPLGVFPTVDSLQNSMANLPSTSTTSGKGGGSRKWPKGSSTGPANARGVNSTILGSPGVSSNHAFFSTMDSTTNATEASIGGTAVDADPLLHSTPLGVPLQGHPAPHFASAFGAPFTPSACVPQSPFQGVGNGAPAAAGAGAGSEQNVSASGTEGIPDGAEKNEDSLSALKLDSPTGVFTTGSNGVSSVGNNGSGVLPSGSVGNANNNSNNSNNSSGILAFVDAVLDAAAGGGHCAGGANSVSSALVRASDGVLLFGSSPSGAVEAGGDGRVVLVWAGSLRSTFGPPSVARNARKRVGPEEFLASAGRHAALGVTGANSLVESASLPPLGEALRRRRITLASPAVGASSATNEHLGLDPSNSVHLLTQYPANHGCVPPLAFAHAHNLFPPSATPLGMHFGPLSPTPSLAPTPINGSAGTPASSSRRFWGFGASASTTEPRHTLYAADWLQEELGVAAATAGKALYLIRVPPSGNPSVPEGGNRVSVEPLIFTSNAAAARPAPGGPVVPYLPLQGGGSLLLPPGGFGSLACSRGQPGRLAAATLVPLAPGSTQTASSTPIPLPGAGSICILDAAASRMEGLFPAAGTVTKVLWSTHTPSVVLWTCAEGFLQWTDLRARSVGLLRSGVAGLRALAHLGANGDLLAGLSLGAIQKLQLHAAATMTELAEEAGVAGEPVIDPFLDEVCELYTEYSRPQARVLAAGVGGYSFWRAASETNQQLYCLGGVSRPGVRFSGGFFQGEKAAVVDSLGLVRVFNIKGLENALKDPFTADLHDNSRRNRYSSLFRAV